MRKFEWFPELFKKKALAVPFEYPTAASERIIREYPDIPRLDASIEKILPTKGSQSLILIPVTESCFKEEDYATYKSRVANLSLSRKLLADDDCYVFDIERTKYIKQGFITAQAVRIDFDLIEITECIQNRGVGDSDGFGVEPDTWIKAYANLQGELVSPFVLITSTINQNINKRLEKNINPFEKQDRMKL